MGICWILLIAIHLESYSFACPLSAGRVGTTGCHLLPTMGESVIQNLSLHIPAGELS